MACCASIMTRMVIAAAKTSGQIQSHAITAIRQVFNGLSFEARRLPAREAVRPADVDRTAARGTLEVAFLRLAAMRAEPHVPLAGQHATGVLELVFRPPTRGTGDTTSLLMPG